jgi:hypothetical protein
MGKRLTAREAMDRKVLEEPLRCAYRDAAILLGWKAMHITQSTKVVNSGPGGAHMVGDDECKGWPDQFFTKGDRALAVEVKRELQHPTPDQVEWLEALAATGIEIFVLRPSNWDEGIALLRRRRGTARDAGDSV